MIGRVTKRDVNQIEHVFQLFKVVVRLDQNLTVHFQRRQIVLIGSATFFECKTNPAGCATYNAKISTAALGSTSNSSQYKNFNKALNDCSSVCSITISPVVDSFMPDASQKENESQTDQRLPTKQSFKVRRTSQEQSMNANATVFANERKIGLHSSASTEKTTVSSKRLYRFFSLFVVVKKCCHRIRHFGQTRLKSAFFAQNVLHWRLQQPEAPPPTTHTRFSSSSTRRFSIASSSPSASSPIRSACSFDLATVSDRRVKHRQSATLHNSSRMAFRSLSVLH